jgi:dTDP-4-dehydrorhamnose reductase
MTLRILQFGASGQLGRELIAAAPAFPVELTALSRAEADLADPASVAEAVRNADADVVLNVAAYNTVDRAEDEPELAHTVNAYSPGAMAKACAQRGLPLIHVSTDSVFSGDKDGPYGETDAPSPISVYGASKLAGEVAVLAANPRSLVVRTSWLFGAHGRNFLQIMLGLARERTKLTVVSDQRARPTASFDLACFLLAVAPRLVAAPAGSDLFGLLHFANVGSATRLDMAQAIFAQAYPAGGGPRLEPARLADFPAKARRPLNGDLDCERLTRVFGYSPRGWREALAEVMGELETDEAAA